MPFLRERTPAGRPSAPGASEASEHLEDEKIAYLEALAEGHPPALETLSPEMQDFALTAVELHQVAAAADHAGDV